MKRLVAICTLLIGIAAPAAAADMKVPVYKASAAPTPYAWTGCYVGANAGAGWANKENVDINLVPNINLGSHVASGAVAGGQIGCDYQWSRLVLGVEATFDWSNLDGRNYFAFGNENFTTKVPWIGSVTGRAGVLVTPSLLAFVEAGFTWLREEHAQVFPIPVVRRSESQSWGGGTVGGGLEFMFAPNWSVFAKYDYTFFADKITTFTGVPGNQRLSLQTALVGLNFRFGPSGPVVAKY